MDLTVHCVTAVLQPALMCYRRNPFDFYLFIFFLKKGTSVWVNSSVDVYSGDGWTRARVQRAENLFTNVWTLCMKVKLELDARGTDKGTSTTSWSSFINLMIARMQNMWPRCYCFIIWSFNTQRQFTVTTILDSIWTILCLYQVWSVRLW